MLSRARCCLRSDLCATADFPPSELMPHANSLRSCDHSPLGPEDIVVVDGVRVIAAGLPLPRLQHTFQTSDGEARADFDWDGRLIGEFDGLQKYGRLLRPGETTRDALIREKQREDALRSQGIMVIRWTWVMLERGGLVAALRPWLTRIGLAAA